MMTVRRLASVIDRHLPSFTVTKKAAEVVAPDRPVFRQVIFPVW